MSVRKNLITLGATSTVIAAWAGAAALGYLSDEGLDGKAAQTLKNRGFDPIEVGGYGWYDCGDAGLVSTRFKATAPNGEIVSGSVCRGLVIGGSTLKLD